LKKKKKGKKRGSKAEAQHADVPSAGDETGGTESEGEGGKVMKRMLQFLLKMLQMVITSLHA
jgi:hypothetical protein